jgi:hypothetical protein
MTADGRRDLSATAVATRLGLALPREDSADRLGRYWTDWRWLGRDVAEDWSFIDPLAVIAKHSVVPALAVFGYHITAVYDPVARKRTIDLNALVFGLGLNMNRGDTYDCHGEHGTHGQGPNMISKIHRPLPLD